MRDAELEVETVDVQRIERRNVLVVYRDARRVVARLVPFHQGFHSRSSSTPSPLLSVTPERGLLITACQAILRNTRSSSRLG